MKIHFVSIYRGLRTICISTSSAFETFLYVKDPYCCSLRVVHSLADQNCKLPRHYTAEISSNATFGLQTLKTILLFIHYKNSIPDREMTARTLWCLSANNLHDIQCTCYFSCILFVFSFKTCTIMSGMRDDFAYVNTRLTICIKLYYVSI